MREIQYTASDLATCTAEAIGWALGLPDLARVDHIEFDYQGTEIRTWGWRGTAQLVGGRLSPLIASHSQERAGTPEHIRQVREGNLAAIAKEALETEYRRAQAAAAREWRAKQEAGK